MSQLLLTFSQSGFSLWNARSTLRRWSGGIGEVSPLIFADTATVGAGRGRRGSSPGWLSGVFQISPGNVSPAEGGDEVSRGSEPRPHKLPPRVPSGRLDVFSVCPLKDYIRWGDVLQAGWDPSPRLWVSTVQFWSLRFVRSGLQEAACPDSCWDKVIGWIVLATWSTNQKVFRGKLQTECCVNVLFYFQQA